MNIELIKAILHVLDPAVDAPILSEAILPPSEDALQYLAGHAATVSYTHLTLPTIAYV